VILLFHDLGNGRTRVDFAHAGWGEGQQWDKLYDYFDAAWSRVLQQLKTYIESPDHVALVPPGADYRRIDRETIIPAPREEVWKAFTTESGISTWLSRGAKVELVPGGAYEMYFNPSAPVGQRGIEGTKVLTFLEPEMFSFRGSAPPEFPNVQRNGPIAVYFFTDLGDGRTRLRSIYIGWSQHDPEWDGAFEHGKVSADVVNRALLARFERGPVDWSTTNKVPRPPASTK
jgi:uncharacterized protein YndB with AHSA1/START domain